MIPQNKKEDVKHRKEIIKGLATFSQIGIMMAGCVVFGLFLGRWLDGVFDTSPWLVLIFTFLGAGAGFKSMYDLVTRVRK